MFRNNMPYNNLQEINQPMQMPNIPLAHAYVPFQNLNCVYPPMEGLLKGTIFPELATPYENAPDDAKK